MAKKNKVSDREIREAAKNVIREKTSLISQTEFNISWFTMRDKLKKKGATLAQIKNFNALVESAPINGTLTRQGGSFNHWAGD